MADNKDGFFEKRFQGSGMSPTGWLMLFIILIVVILAVFIFWIPEQSPVSIVKSIFTGEGVEEGADIAVAVESSGASAERILVDGVYVTIVHFNGKTFNPSVIEVQSGETVRFVNDSNLTMRVGSRPENVSSPYYAEVVEPTAKGEGSTFEYNLTKPGVWKYENLTSTNPRVYGIVFVK